MKKILILVVFVMFSACAKPTPNQITIPKNSHLAIATATVGLTESNDYRKLKTLIGFDPRYTEWCAGYVNTILELSEHDSLNTLGNRNPLLARSFLSYGIPTSYPTTGDIVIFKRGNSGWQGHVGFYIKTDIIDGREYFLVLGGNQGDEVSYEYFPTSKLLGIRKLVHPERFELPTYPL